MKFHKLPHFTRDVTGQHYRPVLSDVSLPRLSERRRRLKFRLLLHQDTRQLSILIYFLRILRPQVCTYLTNMSHFNTRYTGKTDGEGSRSQEYLTFAPEPSCCDDRESKINTIDSIPSPVSIKHGLRTTDYGLRTTDYGLRTTDYGLRTTDYGLRTTDYGLRTTDWA